MSKLSNNPQKVHADWWYYESLGYIDIYHSSPSGIFNIRIPWKKLEASYKRRKLEQADRAKKKAKKGRQP